jgi:hypothetical protein
VNAFKARHPKKRTRLAAKSLVFAISAMAASAYADAPEHASPEPRLEHISTSAKKTANSLLSFKDFSISQTPCYIRSEGMIEKDIPGLRSLFAEAGINVTPDKAAKCSIMVSGYVTMSKPESDRVVPTNAEFLIANRDTVGTVPPAIAGTNDTAEGTADKAKYMVNATSVGDIENAFRAGNMLGGSGAGIAAGIAVSTLDIIAGVSARHKTTPGLASIRASLSMKPGIFLVASHGMDVYAASTREEKPEDLLRAAVRRFVDEFRAVVAASNGEPASHPENVAAGEAPGER